MMLMNKGMPIDIRVIIEGKVRVEEYLLFLYLPDKGRTSYARKRRAKRFEVICHKCARWTCNGKCRSIGMTSINREDKIIFIKDGLCKENFGDIRISLETHPSEVMQKLFDLWSQFQY